MRAFIYLFIFGNLKRELILSLSKIVVVLPLNNMCGLRTHNIYIYIYIFFFFCVLVKYYIVHL